MKIYPTEQNNYHLRFYLVADDENDLDNFVAKKSNTRGYAHSTHLSMTVNEMIFRVLDIHRPEERNDARRFIRCQYQSDGIWDIDIFGPAFKILASHHEAYIQGYETKSLVEWLSLVLLSPEAIQKS